MRSNNKFKAVIIKSFFMTVLFFVFACTQRQRSFSCFNEKCLYLPNSQTFYSASFIDDNNDTTHYEIQMVTTNGKFFLQNKLKYIVERVPNSIFPESFLSESTTGFIETEQKIWLHPPRTAQFKFITQLAPYPEVHLPIIKGDSIKGKINMLGNWGEWSGNSSDFYLYVEKDTSLLINNKHENIYILKGCGKILSDISCVKYLFSLDNGFIYADYKNNSDEQFIIRRKDLNF